LQATIPIANWIKKNVESTVIIGPDKESEQWVSSNAKQLNAP
jgi:ribose-phosphate pyrophosphokinase